MKTDGEKKKAGKIKKLATGEILMVNIGSTSTGARVLLVSTLPRLDSHLTHTFLSWFTRIFFFQTKGDLAKVLLTSPVCSQNGEKLALSRRVDKHWRLIGWGQIRRGLKISEQSSLSGGD